MKKSKKKTKLNNKNINKKIYIVVFFIIVVVFLILLSGYLFYGCDIFKKSVNSKVANYISFNNRYDSDTIKIDSLNKYSNLQGKLSKSIDFNVSSDTSTVYEVILVPINVTCNYKYIKVYLTDKYNSKIIFKTLDKFNINEDSGIVIYTDRLDKNKDNDLKLRVWVDDKYKDELKANSFEVKVKLK